MKIDFKIGDKVTTKVDFGFGIGECVDILIFPFKRKIKVYKIRFENDKNTFNLCFLEKHLKLVV